MVRLLDTDLQGSGQYRCGQVTRHWSTGQDGYCTHPPCHQRCMVESPEHILMECTAYSDTRLNMVSLSLNIKNPIAHSLVISLLLCASKEKFMQFLLDCSVLPEVILAAQTHGDAVYNALFYVSRTWCFAMHRERRKRLGQWNFR